MDINQIQPPLNKFLASLSQQIKVDEVIIFGSYLEGNAKEDSDIDVIVVSDNFKSMEESQRLDILYHASAFIEPDIHPWAFTSGELKQASRLTTWGYARDKGIRF